MRNNSKSPNEDLLAEKLTVNIFLVRKNNKIFIISPFLDEKEKFYAQKKINEEKWRERTMVIENLEEKLDHSDSFQNSIDSDEPMRSSTPKKKLLSTVEKQEKQQNDECHIYDGFDTLRIVKTICDKELEFTERKIEEHNNNNQVKINC